MNAGQGNWRPGPADDWANRQAMEGREVAWAAIGGPSVNATCPLPDCEEHAVERANDLRAEVERLRLSLAWVRDHADVMAEIVDGSPFAVPRSLHIAVRDLGTVMRCDLGPAACDIHKPRQHRDEKPPWCDTCGYTDSRGARPAEQVGKPRDPA